ncbi:hypothetical protein JW766_04085 [Candidatus Dojkabacteria bacterium]|nr:hypothetical protein [Candidatus Dojkabacteria bacterium]
METIQPTPRRRLYQSITSEIEGDKRSSSPNIDDLPDVSLPESLTLEMQPHDWEAWLGDPPVLRDSGAVRIYIPNPEDPTQFLASAKIHITAVSSPTGQIYRFLVGDNFAVRENLRNRGIGSYIQRSLQEMVVDLGIDAFIAEVGPAKIAGARRHEFYKRNGFTILEAGTGDRGMCAIYWLNPHKY